MEEDGVTKKAFCSQIPGSTTSEIRLWTESGVCDEG